MKLPIYLVIFSNFLSVPRSLPSTEAIAQCQTDILTPTLSEICSEWGHQPNDTA